jgi:membrane protease YdiL (CAAX protease family)
VTAQLPSPPASATIEAFGVPWSGGRVLIDVSAIYALALIGGPTAALLLVGSGASQDEMLPALVVFSPIALFVVTVLWLRLRYGADALRARGRVRPQPSDIPVGLGFGVLCFVAQRVIVAAIALVAGRYGLGLPEVQETFRVIAENPDTAPLLLLTAVLLAPLAEELLFRGVLFQGLYYPPVTAARGERPPPRRFWLAALVSASLFTLAHLGEPGGWLANLIVVAGILPLGVAFAWILVRRGSLLTVIATHASYNAIGVALLMFSVL